MQGASFTSKIVLVYPKPTCRSHPKHSEITIIFVLRRSSLFWLTMNLFQVKFNLERTSSCKWKVMKQYENKEETLKPVLLWQETGIEQGDNADTGQSVIWTKQEWKHAKQTGIWQISQHKTPNSPIIWSSEKSDCLKRNWAKWRYFLLLRYAVQN